MALRMEGLTEQADFEGGLQATLGLVPLAVVSRPPAVEWRGLARSRGQHRAACAPRHSTAQQNGLHAHLAEVCPRGGGLAEHGAADAQAGQQQLQHARGLHAELFGGAAQQGRGGRCQGQCGGRGRARGAVRAMLNGRLIAEPQQLVASMAGGQASSLLGRPCISRVLRRQADHQQHPILPELTCSKHPAAIAHLTTTALMPLPCAWEASPCFPSSCPFCSSAAAGCSAPASCCISCRTRMTRGRRKASVLPEPVGAMASSSRPPSRAEAACRWMGVGSVNPLPARLLHSMAATKAS